MFLAASKIIRITHSSWEAHKIYSTSCSVAARGFSNPAARRNGKRLPREKIEAIVRLRRQGKTHPDIALALGIGSASTVCSVFRRFCIAEGSDEIRNINPITPAECNEITELKRAGKQWREIGRLFGRPHQALKNVYYRHAKDPAPRPQEKWNDNDAKYVLHARDELHLSWDDIRRQLDRSKKSVQQRYFRIKLQGKSNRLASPSKYSPEELETLIRLREEHGPNWQKISDRMPGRSIDSVKHRYGEIKIAQGHSLGSKTFYTLEEDRQLEQLRKVQGLPWKEVHLAMPWRTQQSLISRYDFLELSRRKMSTPGHSPAQQAAIPDGARSFSTIAGSINERYASIRHHPVLVRTSLAHLVHRPRINVRFSFASGRRLVHTDDQTPSTEEEPESEAIHSSRRRYTTAEDEVILRRRKDGLSHYEIGIELGRPQGSVRKRFGHLNGTGREKSDSSKGVRPVRLLSSSDIEYLVRERQAGQSFITIGKTLNRHPTTIATRYGREMAKRGLPKANYTSLQKRSLSAAEHESIKTMREEGNLWVHIAAKFGMKARNLSRRYHIRCQKSSQQPWKLATRLPWSDDEVRELFRLRNELGLDWKNVASKLGTGRTTEAVSSFYYTYAAREERRKLSDGEV